MVLAEREVMVVRQVEQVPAQMVTGLLVVRVEQVRALLLADFLVVTQRHWLQILIQSVFQLRRGLLE